jgi:hypothetical protein
MKGVEKLRGFGPKFKPMSALQLCIFFRYSLNTINIVIAIGNPSLLNKITAILSLINLWDTLLWERCDHDMVLVWGTLLGFLNENLSRWDLLRISVLYFLWKPSWFVISNLSSLASLHTIELGDFILLAVTVLMNFVLMFFDIKCMVDEYSTQVRPITDTTIDISIRSTKSMISEAV